MVRLEKLIDSKAEYYKKSDLKDRINNKIKAGLPDDDCYEEGFAYIISIDDFDVMNFSLRDCRKVLPIKVRAFIRTNRDNSQYLYFVPLKNNKPLKKIIEDKVSYKPQLKFFFSEEDMVKEYEKDITVINEIIEKKFSAIFAFKKEIQEAINF